MDIKKELVREHSKARAIKIARYIGNDPELFTSLVKILTGNDALAAQRAGWVLTFCAMDYPEIILPELPGLIDNLYRENLHDAIKRNTIRVMQHVKIPEELQGRAADICFRYLTTATEAVAIRAFAMTVLCNICKEQPDLKNELALVVEEQMRTGEPAILSRGKKTLKIIENL